MDYRLLDGWKYIICLADGYDTKWIEKSLTGKYRGTVAEHNPVGFELNLLAEVIAEDPQYTDFYTFLGNHELRVQNAIFKSKLDIFIRSRKRNNSSVKNCYSCKRIT